MTPQGRDDIDLRDQLLLQINAKVDKILRAQITMTARQTSFDRDLAEMRPMVEEHERKLSRLWTLLKPLTVGLTGAGTAAGGYFFRRFFHGDK